MLAIDTPADLDESARAAVRRLIEEVARLEGHRPLGESKYAQLDAAAGGWTGLLASDDNRLVGYAHVRWGGPRDEPRATAELVVHPDADDEVARRLLDATRAAVARAGGGLLYLWSHHVQRPGATVPARNGFAVQRELAFMTRDLRDRLEVPDPPDGVVIRPYRWDIDDGEFLRVNNAAFAGHPEQGNWDAAEFAGRRSRGWFDPEGLLLAWRGDELLGFHWTKEHGSGAADVPGDDRVGEVYVLGVSPAAQGLGLGRTLLQAGLAHLYDRGCRVAILYVDRATAAAVRLYENAGFTTAHLEVCYEQRIPAGA